MSPDAAARRPGNRTPFPPRPHALDVARVDPCAGLDDRQRAELDLRPGRPGIAQGGTSPACNSPGNDGVGYNLQTLAVDATIAIGAEPTSTVVTVAGFGAVQSSLPAQRTGLPFCRIVLGCRRRGVAAGPAPGQPARRRHRAADRRRHLPAGPRRRGADARQPARPAGVTARCSEPASGPRISRASPGRGGPGTADPGGSGPAPLALRRSRIPRRGGRRSATHRRRCPRSSSAGCRRRRTHRV